VSYTDRVIVEMEDKYGVADEIFCTQDVDSHEFRRIHRSMSRGRTHDITLFVAKDNGFVFIAKHSYPEGLFRAPSGGLNKDEDFIVGAKREAFEETGLDIELERYVLRIRVRFQSSDGHIDWTSHVFMARHIAGAISPRDTYEIREARLVTLDEIPRFQEIMRKSNIGGFQYRAFLTDEVLKRL
jgi:8-oxo-dGTP pyrophosphatase MutT (NUDIX family)